MYFNFPGFFRNLFDKKDGVQDGREDFIVHAFMLDHPVPCVGYLLLEPAPLPTLLASKAISLGVKPGPLMGKLKAVRSCFNFSNHSIDITPCHFK